MLAIPATDEIRAQFPKHRSKRRNNGLCPGPVAGHGAYIYCYAWAADFQLLYADRGIGAPSAFITEINAGALPPHLPPRKQGCSVSHFISIDESLRATLIALRHRPGASELIATIS